MSRCPACPAKYECVEPNGPCEQGGIYALGEAPGYEENRKKEPFIGKTGREVNEAYLPLAGLRRSAIRFNNSIRCLPDTPQNKLDLKKEPHRELLRVCSEHHLLPELERLKPRLIIAMGAFACRVLDPSIELELQHGIPVQTAWGTVFPMYHPAGGIHEPKKMLHIRTDWYRLKQYLKGQLKIAVDPFVGAEDYGTIEDPYELNYDLGGMQDLPLACDTENRHDGTPFCLTYSTFAGRGRLVRATDLASLSHFQKFLNEWEGPILWHNWLHDNKITDPLGLVFPRKKIVDTMVRVFELGNLPQGLKALSYRELGMRMLDFDDLVTPHSTPLALRYLRQAMDMEWPKPEPIPERQSDGTIKIRQPQKMGTKIKSALTRYQKDASKDMYELWGKWEDEHELIQSIAGKWPSKCISHAAEADWKTTEYYACRDADALGRFYRDVLRPMERRVRRGPQESWRDAA